MSKNVLVTIPISDELKRFLESRAPGCSFTYTTRSEVTPEQMQSANIIFGDAPPQLLKDCKKLEWMQLESSGVGAYIAPGVLPEGVKLTNCTGAYGIGIAEYMLGAVLSLYRKLYLYRDNQNNAVWRDERDEVKNIYGTTVLVVGLGDIGGTFAQRMKAMGAHTIGIRRQNMERPDYLDELYTMDRLDELLPRADIVAMSLPSTPLTMGLITKERLLLMKKDAVILNVGRGNAIDTEALCDVMGSGHLWGAALDVTEPEPLPKEHRLWRIPNAIVTPHISGSHTLPVVVRAIVGIAARNLDAYLNGRELENYVDFVAGYRKA